MDKRAAQLVPSRWESGEGKDATQSGDNVYYLLPRSERTGGQGSRAVGTLEFK